MKKSSLIGIVLLILLSTWACTAGPNNFENTAGIMDTAGFWKGLWHGFISLFTFIFSLFRDNVNIYEVHNNGGWYNFGFILGVITFYGGSKEGHTKACSKKKD